MSQDTESNSGRSTVQVELLELTLRKLLMPFQEQVAARLTRIDTALELLASRLDDQAQTSLRSRDDLDARLGLVDAQLSAVQSSVRDQSGRVDQVHRQLTAVSDSVQTLSERLDQQEVGVRRLRNQLSDRISGDLSIRKASAGVAPPYVSEKASPGAGFYESESEQRSSSQVAQ